jgi:DNA-binding NarL/FixJ family response regulator
MINAALVPPQALSLPRSCARCGKGFRTSAKRYVCPDCRREKRQNPRHGNSRLSFREQQIVALIRQAKANKEIAYELCLTEGTVKEYLYHIFRKLNVTSRTELALRSYHETLRLEIAENQNSPQCA